MLALASGARGCYSNPERLTTTTYQEYAIMAIITLPRPAKPAPPDFDDLLTRLQDLICHFRLVDERLFDLQRIPEELQPAAVVLHQSTETLDKWYNELDEWHVTHTHEPRPDIPPEVVA